MTLNVVTVRSSTTGKYHRTYESSRAIFCNASGQRRLPSHRPALAEEVAKASEQMFCKKCFPNGKPAE